MICFIFDKIPDPAVTEGEPADPSLHRCIEHLGGKDHPQAKNHTEIVTKTEIFTKKTEIVTKYGNCHKKMKLSQKTEIVTKQDQIGLERSAN